MVRLKESNVGDIWMMTSCFNSSMVRLKVEPSFIVGENVTFQFLYGAIKSKIKTDIKI